MRKNIQLSIPEPCHEDWDKMTTIDRGKFCGACQKNVIDFTTMSDDEVVAFFRKKSTGSTCGRFMNDQLDRHIEIPRKRIPWIKYFFQVALPALLVSSKVSAQGKVVVKGDTIMTPIDTKKPSENKQARVGEKKINGRVLDNNDIGVPYASVFIKGTTIGSAADSAGSFTLKYAGTEDCITITSSCVGFESTETEINLNAMEETILLRMAGNDLLGEVVVTAAGFAQTKGRFFMGGISSVTTISFLDTISNIFCSKPAFKLYPNPIQKNNSLTIEMGKLEKGMHLIQLAGSNGQVALRKEFWLEEKSRTITIDIPAVAAGTYLVTVINKKSGKKSTEKIVVE